MKRIKALALLLMILSSLTLTGCINSIQLNERALIQAVGIDYEEDKYHLTFQIFDTSSEAGSGLSASADNAKIIESYGDTISQAVQNATLVQGKILFIGQCDVLIIGSELAKKGMRSTLSYFDTIASARKNMHLLIADTNASDVLKAKINQGILPADAIGKIIQSTQKNGMLYDRRLFDILRAFENKHESATIPVIRLKKSEEKSVAAASGGGSSGGGSGGGSQGKESQNIEEVSSVEIYETAVIKEAKLVDSLTKEETTGLLFLNDNIETAVLTVSTSKYDIASLKVFKSKTVITPSIKNEKITFNIDINSDAVITETMLKEGESVSIDAIVGLEQSCAKKIEGYIKSAFDKGVKQNGADIFNLGNIIWKENSDFWSTIHGEWSDRLKSTDIKVNCKVNIDRIGLEFDTDSEL